MQHKERFKLDFDTDLFAAEMPQFWSGVPGPSQGTGTPRPDSTFDQKMVDLLFYLSLSVTVWVDPDLMWI